MKYLILVISFLLLASNTLSSQYISSISYPDSTTQVFADTSDPSVEFANTIKVEDLKKHIFTLASDEYEGRETGEAGNDKAANYIANHFKTLGLPSIGVDNGYFQPVAFTFTKWNDTEVNVNGKKFKHLWEYISFPKENQDLDSFTADEIIFLGYGIDSPNYSDYRGVDVKDKVILIYKGEPINDKGKSLITGKKQHSIWKDNIAAKCISARNHGAKLVLIVEDDIKGVAMENRRFLLGAQVSLGDLSKRKKNKANSALISTNVLEEIIGDQKDKLIATRDLINSKGKPQHLILKTDFSIKQDKGEKILLGQNVLGFIEGTDLKDEVVVVSAHYDHLGKRGENDIYNGADDNGSGTTTVLEIAEGLAKAKAAGNGPRRSVLCLLVTGEEKGLLGSEYYAENPIFPLANTVVDVNIDMVGRYDEKYVKDSSEYIYVIGSDRLSSELHTINEKVNDKYSKLILDYTFNSEDDPNRYYYRSDHYNFAEKGIPAIFFFSGVHEDYHRTSDTPEKIQLEKMGKIGQHIFHLIWELANQEKRIEVDVVVEKENK